ncbi:MAG: hypothetical protein ACR2GH_17705 [Pseudonocardia sp.]
MIKACIGYHIRPWYQVTGSLFDGDGRGALIHDEVRDWPVVSPLVGATAFRHAEHQRIAEQAAEGRQGPVLEGDMGVEAFKGTA